MEMDGETKPSNINHEKNNDLEVCPLLFRIFYSFQLVIVKSFWTARFKLYYVYCWQISRLRSNTVSNDSEMKVFNKTTLLSVETSVSKV